MLILASQSAARASVLHAAGLTFEARPARIDEAAVKHAVQAEGGSAAEAALALAGLKAQRIREPGEIIIGADQILVCGERWFDKPVDLAAAAAHLRVLRGQTHELVTAVVCWRDGREIWRHTALPRLRMRPFSDAFLDEYLAAEGETLCATVGAYRIEGRGVQLFDRIEGEHSAILGLPLLPLLGFLRQAGALQD